VNAYASHALAQRVDGSVEVERASSAW
jgi:hypothetical protein